MYAKEAYHDPHYLSGIKHDYDASIKILSKVGKDKMKVLDYGCGVGLFLKALKVAGFIPVGVEFDFDAARFAAENSGCEVYEVSGFLREETYQKFDVLHLGDVLEHLPDPMNTLRNLMRAIRPGGFIFIEGPLETNPSPVYWTAKTYGAMGRILNLRTSVDFPPTHLMRVDAQQQFDFFRRLSPDLKLVYWEVYETGWPYSYGGFMKQAIAKFARQLGGIRVFGCTFGNRFRGIFRVPELR